MKKLYDEIIQIARHQKKKVKKDMNDVVCKVKEKLAFIDSAEKTISQYNKHHELFDIEEKLNEIKKDLLETISYKYKIFQGSDLLFRKAKNDRFEDKEATITIPLVGCTGKPNYIYTCLRALIYGMLCDI